MNIYKGTTVGLIVGMVVACGAAGSDPASVAYAAEAGAGNGSDCTCMGQPGPAGEVGPQGPAGPAGKDAVCGTGMVQCPAGVPGPAGATGPAGTNGSSCSASGNGDSVHVNCTDGTAATITAPAGVKGDKGDPGAKGDTGSQGVPGEQGVPGKDGKDGTSITKSSIYTTSSGLTAGDTIAYCKDENDVVLNGMCVGQGVLWGVIGPYLPTNPDFTSGWECKVSNVGGNPVSATAVCLDVP